MSALDVAIDTIVASLRAGGTLYACGNGGSDAHAGHLVAELVGRFAYDRPPLRAVHLSSGGPVGSAIANDYGWGAVFSRQVQALMRPGDVLVVLTTSGRSQNINWALGEASGPSIALTGPEGQAEPGFTRRTTVDGYIQVRSSATTTAGIQEEHQRLVHEIARRVEMELCPR